VDNWGTFWACHQNLVLDKLRTLEAANLNMFLKLGKVYRFSGSWRKYYKSVLSNTNCDRWFCHGHHEDHICSYCKLLFAVVFIHWQSGFYQVRFKFCT
jgi:hypothetical protein